MSRAEWFSMKARVAVAVAVIRNRPPGMSGRQYAEALGRQLRLQDEGGKKKAEELQQEVLRLRQEVLIAKATSAGKSSAQAADSSRMHDPSQDLFGPGSAGFSEESQPDCDSETPELFQQDAEPPLPSGPREEDALGPHVQFLQSLCALHRVERRGRGLEALWFGRDGDTGSVLADTVCRLLDSVAAACRDPSVLGSHTLILKACQVSARAMDLYCSQRLPSAELMRRVGEPLRELSGMLLHSDQPGRSQLEAAEKLTEYLIAVGSSRVSASILIRHILSEISALADQLWQAFQAQGGPVLDTFPVAQYQNSCHLFGVLEELLQRPEVVCGLEVGSERAGFLSHVEQRVFLLSDEFPLFCIRMWRIGGILASLNRQDGPECLKQP